jgi:hypothetical protein
MATPLDGLPEEVKRGAGMHSPVFGAHRIAALHRLIDAPARRNSRALTVDARTKDIARVQVSATGAPFDTRGLLVDKRGAAGCAISAGTCTPHRTHALTQ